MNSIENELHGYINGTEAMSGFDSYDSYEGDMSYFDDDSYDNFYDGDNFSYAEGSANVGVSDPYVIQYTTSVTSGSTAVLFGYNDHFGFFGTSSANSNYGNPTTTTITNLQGGTYGRLVGQTATKNFKIEKNEIIKKNNQATCSSYNKPSRLTTLMQMVKFTKCLSTCQSCVMLTSSSQTSLMLHAPLRLMPTLTSLLHW